ncbi:hypothetical protein K474DRAFT_1656160 [Panus rudis PR-1116 ss-1]|nr:hypothetical protein K474DRAFT_1656160 [Panus rudis PR-1116 ss-1]
MPYLWSWSTEYRASNICFNIQAAKAYEHHVSKNGPPPTHEKAKELLAGFAGAFIDREVESKGLDFVDKERAKREGK